MIDNTWLKTNKNSIDTLLVDIESYRLKGSYGGNLNLFQIGRMLKGAIKEIETLQEKINDLSKSNVDIQKPPGEEVRPPKQKR